METEVGEEQGEAPSLRRRREESTEAQSSGAVTAASLPGGAEIPSRRYITKTEHVDPKLLDRPQPFDGMAASWRLWKLRTTGWLVAVDNRYRTWLREAEQWTSEIVGVTPQATELSEFLYAELLAWLRGEQLEI